MNINALLSQARSLRMEATSLTRKAATASRKRATAATSDTLDHLVRTGRDPTQINAVLAQPAVGYSTAKKDEEALQDMAERFGKMFSQLSAAVDAKDTSGEQDLLQGEIALCIGVMAELGAAVRNAAVFETSVAAAKAAAFETSVATALASKTESGLIIGAAASTPQIILPTNAGIQRVS